ncbi:MAG: glycosyltransferase, partial [Pseudomonadota bacterium]|nr:glycosyltransferase [Pseudomonadota bacterium]
MTPGPPPPDISIVVPVFNEEGAAAPLAREIAAAFAGEAFEIVFVDDAGADGTRAALAALAGEIPQLRVLAHRRNAGQSRAIRTGVAAARAPIVV